MKGANVFPESFLQIQRYAPVATDVGDPLSSSPMPGHAMRAQEATPGTIVGKALESMDNGTGTIRVLVMLR